ncbi:MAG TPA: nucleoside-diphosphate sugar epimerase/dehydratase [Flavobacterium sp.]|nr:nucleoside-diphosphate sugar epimerase/dehydratase [Flavobacterium sp.]
MSRDTTHKFRNSIIIKLGDTLRNLGYLPRWIILFIDIFVLCLSLFLTYFILDRFDQEYFLVDYKIVGFALYFIVNIFFFRLYRIYSGIIRYSSYVDAFKIFFSQVSALIVFSVINLAFYIIYKDFLFLGVGLVINFGFSFSGLFIYRLLIKYVFDKYIIENKKKSRIRAMIYGSDANAISVASALHSEIPNRFKIVGFVDKYSQNTSKRILDLPIFAHSKKIHSLMRINNAQALILTDKSLTKEEQISIVDSCLEYNYKVYVVPIISDWANQKEISKKVTSFQIQDLLERKPIVLDNKSISEQLTGKSILITGAAGSIGSEIVWQVLKFNPKKVIMVDQAETPLYSLSLELNNQNYSSNIYAIVADIRQEKVMEQIFSKHMPDVVYHAAAYKHVPLMEENPCQAIFTNVLGTKIIADLACKYNASKFVMISTDKAVNPSNVMGASKRIAEKYVQSLYFNLLEHHPNSKTKFITTRFGNVLGSNGSVVPLFSKQIAEGGPLTITHPDVIRYFMTIPEACQLVLEAGAMGNGGEIYIFDMGKPVKIIDLARKMIKLAGFIPDKDIEIKIVGLRKGEKLYEELLNDSEKTLNTYHEKIMIAQEEFADYHSLAADIESLYIEADTYNKEAVVLLMKKIVPEFRSMNSVYEVLDK